MNLISVWISPEHLTDVNIFAEGSILPKIVLDDGFPFAGSLHRGHADFIEI